MRQKGLESVCNCSTESAIAGLLNRQNVRNSGGCLLQLGGRHQSQRFTTTIGGAFALPN